MARRPRDSRVPIVPNPYLFGVPPVIYDELMRQQDVADEELKNQQAMADYEQYQKDQYNAKSNVGKGVHNLKKFYMDWIDPMFIGQDTRELVDVMKYYNNNPDEIPKTGNVVDPYARSGATPYSQIFNPADMMNKATRYAATQVPLGLEAGLRSGLASWIGGDAIANLLATGGFGFNEKYGGTNKKPPTRDLLESIAWGALGVIPMEGATKQVLKTLRTAAKMGLPQTDRVTRDLAKKASNRVSKTRPK